MLEEDKKAIEILKEITTDDLLNCWEGGEKEYNAIQTILNLIQSQQKEIESLKQAGEATETVYKMQLEKKDKIIDLMATDIYGMQIECNRYFGNIEEVKEKFEKKVESK